MMLASQDLKCEPIGQPGDVEASSTSPPNIKPEPQVTTPINLSLNNPINDFTSMFGAQLRQLAIFQQMQNQGEQHSAPAPPLFNNPEAMLNYFQAQMAKMQPPPMNNQPTRVVIAPQQSQNGERKRSYPMTFQWCELCQKEVHSSKLPCHIRQCHVAKPMFQCPQCDFTSTYSKNNVKSHMVSLHGLAGDPISYMDQYAGQVEEFMKRCFPHVRGRGRPIQGRTSPTSPGSSGNVSRRNSQATPPNRRPNPTFPTFDFSQAQSQLAAVLAARRCGDQPPIYGLPPLNPFLPVFPPGFPLPLGILNNNNIAHNMRKPTMNDGPMMTDPTENAVTLASTLGELLNKTNSTATARSPSPLSPGSNGSFTRPGENLQPKYTPIRIDCVVLNDDQIRPTIFNTLPPFSELLEKIEWKDSLSDAGKTRPVSPTHCLAIRNMREDLGHHLIDIFLAITGNFRNLQIEKLTHKSVQRLIEVAPSPVDALTFRTFESTYPNENLSDDEQFIVQMSRIERLEEKLHLLSWMTELREEAPRLMKELEVLHEARQAIASEHWRDMMQIVLVLLNMSLGDRSMASIKGIDATQLDKLFELALPTGKSLLEELVSLLRSRNDCIWQIAQTFDLMEKAAEINYTEIARRCEELQNGLPRVDKELQLCGQTLNETVPNAQEMIDDLSRAYCNTKDELQSAIIYMGHGLPRNEEPLPVRHFFQSISRIVLRLKEQIESNPLSILIQ